MKQYKSVKEVWDDLDKGVTIYWGNDSYKVYVSPLNKDIPFQVDHFAARDGKILSVRCISNYFGSIIDRKEFSQLYSN